MFSEQAHFFLAEYTEGWWEEDLKSQSHTAAQKGEAEKVRYKCGTRLSNSQSPRSYTVYADSSNTFQCIKDLMPMGMKKSSNTVKFCLQKGIQLSNVHIYN